MLELHSITKSFGERRVLDSVSFTVGAGRMTGFVGGNGAGKTTTMRVILGVLNPESGHVTLNGAPLTQEQRKRFGYMPEERGLYPKMKVAEQIVYLGRLHGMTMADAQSSTDDLLESLGLDARRNDTVESLSLGNQQRAQIAAGLVHRPQVLVLDEPFSGLDPMAVEVVMGVLNEFRARGVPVLFSSHQLDIVERLCDDLVVIANGQIRAAGSRDALKAQHSGNSYELDVAGDAGWVRSLPGIQVTELDGGFVRFAADNADAAQQVLHRAVTAGQVHRFTPLQPSLSQIFQEVIQ